MSTTFERAKKVIPGGVNSPVRSFKAVGRDPIFIAKAMGSKIYDTEGNEYIDYVASWGPMILGHNHPEIRSAIHRAVDLGISYGAPTEIEVEMAEFVTAKVPNVDMVRMVSSGTEAVMSALRLARGYTKKNKVIKFEGCYHGHTDSMLVSAGSGLLTLSNPDSAGVTEGQAKDTLIATFNDLKNVEDIFKANPSEIAAVIVEPLPCNMGVVLPKKGFLEGLRSLCDQFGALLIFDEVITGFRLNLGGAQSAFGVKADLVTFGKIIGGGMPVGAYGGRADIMACIAPLGSVYQAGTLSGNPVAMVAGLTQLQLLERETDLYDRLTKKTERFAECLLAIKEKLNLPITVNYFASLVCVFFVDGEVADFNDAKRSDTALYAVYFQKMLQKGINIAPAQFEAMFIGDSHTEEDLEITIAKIEETFTEMKAEGYF